jgi:hypothetical protein
MSQKNNNSLNLLLLGDMSSFYENLKIGFTRLGHNVVHFTDGDGYKKTHMDLKRSKIFSKNVFFRLVYKIWFYIWDIFEFRGYDFVFLSNPNVFTIKFNYNYLVTKKLKKITSIMILSSASSTFTYYNVLKYMKYNAIQENIDSNKLNKDYYSKKIVNNEYKIISIVDIIIPATHTYSLGFKDMQFKVLDFIPFPIVIDRVPSFKLIGNNKINILYGITRNGFKGSKYILPALNRIKEEFSEKVNVVICERLKLEEYLILMQDCDILVDQAISFEYGYNALYAMRYGKVVLSGNDSLKFNKRIKDKYKDKEIINPVININPNSTEIYDTICDLIHNPKKIDQLKLDSFEYVKTVHNSEEIAKDYLLNILSYNESKK